MPIAAIATRVVGLWILGGAILKLLHGSPADLPQLVQDLPLRAALAFKLVIGLELVIGTVALLRPRRGWLPALVLLAAFLSVLTVQVMQGKDDCGCFGAALTISPGLMLAIDGTLLLLLLLTKPWRMKDDTWQLAWGAVALVALLGVAVPWVLDREGATPGNVGSGNGLKRYVDLDVENWSGKPLAETSLGPWLSEKERIRSGIVVIWRASCEVCADHLLNLTGTEQGHQDVVLLKLPKEDDEEKNVVELLPEGEWVQNTELPSGIIWLVTPPVHIEIEDGLITKITQGMDVLN